MKAKSEQHSLELMRSGCEVCRHRKLCLAGVLTDTEPSRFSAIVKRSRKLSRGAHLFRMGDHFTTLYVVCSGSFKSYFLTDAGAEQVVGFALPGDLVGLDAMGTTSHTSAAQALETAVVCEISVPGLKQITSQSTALRCELVRQMSKQIQNGQRHVSRVSNRTVGRRLAATLMDFAIRFGDRGIPAHEFRLHATRRDLGNYIGTSTETTSRLLTLFRDMELLEVNRKRVHILDFDGLRRYASQPRTFHHSALHAGSHESRAKSIHHCQ